MSPEIIRGDPGVKGEPDYWALGVVLYRIFTKVCPFDAKHAFDIFDNVLDYKINWKLLENKNLNPDLLVLIKGFLTYDPNERICNMKQVIESPLFKGKPLTFNSFYRL